MFGKITSYITEKLTPQAPPPEERHEILPFDLYLTTGSGSLLTFPRGPIDPFAFFQRRDVSDHKVEFLSRQDPGTADEDYRPYGILRFRPTEALTLVRPRQVQKLYDTLTKGYGLRRMPEAAAMTALTFHGGLGAEPPESRGAPGAQPPRMQGVQRGGGRKRKHRVYAEPLAVQPRVLYRT